MKEETTPIETIDEYIEAAPPHVRGLLSEMRAIVRKAAPGAAEKISYRMPSFHENGVLVYFGAFKSHIGFYPTASGTAAFPEDLKRYKSSKGAVQLPLDEPLPAELITKIVKLRVAMNAEKKGTKKPKAR